jgi:transketolase
MNAGSKGMANASERAVSKSQTNYKNSEWDMVDAVEEGKIDLDSLKDNELPAELKGKNKEEQQKILDEKTAKRKAYQEKINDLAKKRSDFIAEEKKKRAEEAGKEDLGSSIIKTMNTSAEKKGYKVKQ